MVLLSEVHDVVMQLLVLLLDDLLAESLLINSLVRIIGLGSPYFLGHIEQSQNIRCAGKW